MVKHRVTSAYNESLVSVKLWKVSVTVAKTGIMELLDKLLKWLKEWNRHGLT